MAQTEIAAVALGIAREIEVADAYVVKAMAAADKAAQVNAIWSACDIARGTGLQARVLASQVIAASAEVATLRSECLKCKAMLADVGDANPWLILNAAEIAARRATDWAEEATRLLRNLLKEVSPNQTMAY